jgi:peroxiredoxin
MLGIGQKFPRYSLTGVVSNDQAKAFQPFDQDTHQGKWRVVFFWPKDFTFVCPTEIAAFGKLDKEFKARDAQVLGVSTDSEYVHHAWRSTKDELKTCTSRISTWAAAPTKCCACSMRCRPTSFARATGSRARTRSRPPDPRAPGDRHEHRERA